MRRAGEARAAAAAGAPANDAQPGSGAGRHGKRKVADGRHAFIGVRCNAAEYAAITAAAAQAGLGAGAYLRSLALGTAGPRARRQPPAHHAPLTRLLGLLGNYGGNLTQLGQVAEGNGAGTVKAALEAIGDPVHELRRLVMAALGRGGRTRNARPDPAALGAALALATGHGEHLNRLARTANTSGELPSPAELAEIARHVRDIRAAVLAALGSPAAGDPADGD